MSRQVIEGRLPGRCFPRVSGDEPIPAAYRDNMLLFSPRERG